MLDLLVFVFFNEEFGVEFVEFEICSQGLTYTMRITACKEKMVCMDPLWFGFQRVKQSRSPTIMIGILYSPIGIIKAAMNTPPDWLPPALPSPGSASLM